MLGKLAQEMLHIKMYSLLLWLLFDELWNGSAKTTLN